MDFDLSAPQSARIERIREGAAKLEAPAPGAVADRSAWKAAAQLGLTGLCLPEQYGGGGLGALDTALCLEAFCDGGADTGLAFGIAAHLLACGIVFAEHAAADVRDELLPGLARGELIAANAMTEDGAGSDVSRLATTATRNGEFHTLDGEKAFVSNAPLADVFVVYATTEPGAGYLGISAFAVPRKLTGLRIGAPLEKLGLDGCAAARVAFAGCRVPRRYLLGTENQGSAVFQKSMLWERACLPALFLGVMTAELRQCVAHARERRQFGRRIGDFQAVSHRLALMKQRLDGSRLLVYRACWCIDRDRPDAGESAALAKAAVAEAAVANAVDAVQVFGGRGYQAANGIGRHLCDAIGLPIFSGTTEIQREIVARGLGL